MIQRVTYEIEPGIAYVLDPRDVIESALLDKGTWDDEVWSMVAGHLKPGATLIDIGAHIGTFSIPGAKAVGTTGRVVAVEPNPMTVARLNANIAASGWKNILVEPVACGDTNGTLPLYIGSQVNSGTSSLAKANAVDHGAKGGSVDVPIERLDDIVKRARLTRIDAIKIDVEGAETGVIKGGEMSIRTFHPVIVLEVVDQMLKNMGSSKAELESVLRGYGYVKTRENSSHDNAEWSPAPSLVRLRVRPSGSEGVTRGLSRITGQ